MAFCKNCGAEIGSQETFCKECGVSQVNGPVPQEDKGGFLWGLLGFVLPIVGLVLFLVWKSSKPKTSKAAGLGALISTILGVIFYILIMVIGFGSAMYYY